MTVIGTCGKIGSNGKPLSMQRHGRQPTGEDRQATEVVVAVVDV